MKTGRKLTRNVEDDDIAAGTAVKLSPISGTP
jgi:hypothetical protein